MTTADVSCVGYLYFTDEFGVDMADFPQYRPLARCHRRPAALEAPLRPDAGASAARRRLSPARTP